jgi:hypothetical protein
MLDAKELQTILQKMGSAQAGELRRGAERRLEAVTAQLLDAKVRHSLSATTDLSELTDALLADIGCLSAAGAVVLDRFRYRLAHVAMRNQRWDLASDLLDAVVKGSSELTRARLYRTVCSLRADGRVDDDALRQLVQGYRREGMERPGAAPLDVLVQDPTTCLLELLLLCQGSEPELLDQLYDDQGRLSTTGLSLFIQPQEERASRVVLSEWLAQAHLEEWSKEGWLVVDATAKPVGELGRGSRLKSPNMRSAVLIGLAQVLAKAAAVDSASSLSPDATQQRFEKRDAGRLLNPDQREPRWSYVTSAVLVDHPSRKVIERTDLLGDWRLIPPYAVVHKDSSIAKRQAAGSCQ